MCALKTVYPFPIGSASLRKLLGLLGYLVYFLYALLPSPLCAIWLSRLQVLCKAGPKRWCPVVIHRGRCGTKEVEMSCRVKLSSTWGIVGSKKWRCVVASSCRSSGTVWGQRGGKAFVMLSLVWNNLGVSATMAMFRSFD